jgi:hypothetical protein
MNLSNKETIKDIHFGDMDVHFDRDLKTFSLLKTDKLTNSSKVDVYFESLTKSITDKQKQTYQLINGNFDGLLDRAFHYLIDVKKYLRENARTEFKIESITIFNKGDKPTENWTLDLINLKDGFSHIIIEFYETTPIDFEVRA